MRLYRLAANFKIRTDSILRVFHAPPEIPNSTQCSDAHIVARDGALIRLQDDWGRFCRDLILISAVGGCSTVAGIALPNRAASPRDALTILRSSFSGRAKPPDWEPKWFIANQALDAARRLRVGNLAAVSGALGSTPSPLEEIRVLRNFVAHRSERAAIEARRYSGLNHLKGLHAYLQSLQSGGSSLLETWVRQLQVMAESAVQ